MEKTPLPNIVYVFSDQHRAEATGYAGNPDVLTPHLDKLAKESVSFARAVAGIPVCCPSRACLMTGQYPLTHGIFVNDVPLGDTGVSMAEAFKAGGYDTAYIGKWHLDGRGRSAFIPKERRKGFDFWRVMECTHRYHSSYYYGDEPVKLLWPGYDAEEQTRCAQEYIRSRQGGRPFLLVLSFGPPHDPYDTAPEAMRRLYDPSGLTLRPNVPKELEERSRRDLAGYYAHVTAIDACVGRLLETLREEGLEENTIFVYTSDHGDMLGSQGLQRKQKPYDESILVPFLLRYPRMFGSEGRVVRTPINTPDILPTLLGLSGLPIPDSVEGSDYSAFLRSEAPAPAGSESALLMCIQPNGEWHRGNGGKEYRGVRTERYTYVRDLNGPWLLFDNEEDPYQLRNLCGDDRHAALARELEELLQEHLARRNDEFLPGPEYVRRWGYVTDETGTVPYIP